METIRIYRENKRFIIESDHKYYFDSSEELLQELMKYISMIKKVHAPNDFWEFVKDQGYDLEKFRHLID